jgi:hypothetical protein
MVITKKLIPTLFIATLIMLTITGSRQLNAMNPTSLCELRRTGPETVKTNDEILLDADFQAYKLLSLNNNPEYFLPTELIQIIATNVSKIIDKYCYEKYGTYLNHPTFLLKFIQDRCDKSICHISTANIIKRCLRYTNKSLGEIKDGEDRTVFICAIDRKAHNNIYIELIKTLKLVAGNEAWGLICMQDISKFTILTWAAPLDFSVVNELLSSAPNFQAVWDLIMTPDTYGNTAFGWARDSKNTGLIQLFESYRPKEQ